MLRQMRRRLLAAEAACYLLVARLLIAIVPFKRLVWFFTLEPKRVALSDAAMARALHEVPWAIAAAANRLPGAFVCFPRATAAQAMLRRRGVPTTLYYGAARAPEQGLLAHVWLQHEDEGILGHEVAGDYRVVARYPEPRTKSASQDDH